MVAVHDVLPPVSDWHWSRMVAAVSRDRAFEEDQSGHTASVLVLFDVVRSW